MKPSRAGLCERALTGWEAQRQPVGRDTLLNRCLISVKNPVRAPRNEKVSDSLLLNKMMEKKEK